MACLSLAHSAHLLHPLLLALTGQLVQLALHLGDALATARQDRPVLLSLSIWVQGLSSNRNSFVHVPEQGRQLLDGLVLVFEQRLDLFISPCDRTLRSNHDHSGSHISHCLLARPLHSPSAPCHTRVSSSPSAKGGPALPAPATPGPAPASWIARLRGTQDTT